MSNAVDNIFDIPVYLDQKGVEGGYPDDYLKEEVEFTLDQRNLILEEIKNSFNCQQSKIEKTIIDLGKWIGSCDVFINREKNRVDRNDKNNVVMKHYNAVSSIRSNLIEKYQKIKKAIEDDAFGTSNIKEIETLLNQVMDIGVVVTNQDIIEETNNVPKNFKNFHTKIGRTLDSCIRLISRNEKSISENLGKYKFYKEKLDGFYRDTKEEAEDNKAAIDVLAGDMNDMTGASKRKDETREKNKNADQQPIKEN